MFYCCFLSFLFFLQREISQLPRAIAPKLCHMIRSMFNFIIQVEKFGAQNDSSRVRRKTSGELWSINNKVGDVS